MPPSLTCYDYYFNFLKFIYFVFDVSIATSMCARSLPGAQRSDLELELTVSLHVGAGN